METWVWITLIAAFAQNLRSSLQKHARDRLSVMGSTYSRFLFAAPLAVAYLALLTGSTSTPIPIPAGKFYLFSLVGGAAQVIGTGLLVHLFGERTYTVAIAFSKTESVFAALFGFIVLTEVVSGVGMAAIVLGVVGIWLFSLPEPIGFQGWADVTTPLVGFASGAMFAVAAVAFRGASLSLESDFVLSAAITLAFVTVVQAVAAGLVLVQIERGQFTKVVGEWRVTALVGASGMIASAAWFTAMTLQNVAYVRALGQIELLFSFVVTYWFFRERPSWRELAGVALLGLGIVGLLLAG